MRTERDILDLKKEWNRESDVAESGREIHWLGLFVRRDCDLFVRREKSRDCVSQRREEGETRLCFPLLFSASVAYDMCIKKIGL